MIARGIRGLLSYASGTNRVAPRVAAARLSRCARCRYRTGAVVARCSLCGCVLRAKAALAREHCPAGEW